MKIKQVLNDNPEVVKEMLKFFSVSFLESVVENHNVPDSFKKLLINDGINYTLLLGYLKNTPRLVCDFMDAKEIIILLTFKNNNFSFKINEEFNEEFYKTRKEAEYASVVESIKYYANSIKE